MKVLVPMHPRAACCPHEATKRRITAVKICGWRRPVEEKKSTEISCGIALCKKSGKLYVFEGQTWFGPLPFAWWLLLVVFVSPTSNQWFLPGPETVVAVWTARRKHRTNSGRRSLVLKTAGFMDEMNGNFKKKSGSFWHWNNSIFINFWHFLSVLCFFVPAFWYHQADFLTWISAWQRLLREWCIWWRSWHSWMPPNCHWLSWCRA